MADTSLEGVLARIPGLSGYLAQQQYNENQTTGQIGNASKLVQLQEAIRQHQESQALKATLAQTGGDLEQALPLLIKSGQIKGAHDLAPLLKLQQEKTQTEETRKALTELYGPQQLSGQGAGPETTDAKRTRLQEMSKLYARNPTVQTMVQKELDKLDNPSNITAKIVQDKSSPTGWSHADVRTGKILMTGAPPPTSSAAMPGQNPLGNDPNFWYEYYDKTKTLPPMAWGQAGNPTREAFLKGFPEWKKSLGGTASDTATSQAEFKSNAAGLNRVTIDLNTFEPYKKMLDTNADIAIALGKKINQTAPALLNKPINWLKQNASTNPDVAEYLAQIRFVQTEAARVINNPRIVGQLTDQSRSEIESVINGNAPISVVERVLNRLKMDGNNRFNAMRGQQREIISSMRRQSLNVQPPGGTIFDQADEIISRGRR